MEEPALQQEQPEGLYNGFAFEHNAANHSYFESQENLGGSLKYRVIVVQTSALDRQLYEKLYQTRKKTFDTDLARAGKSTDNAGSALPVQIQDSATLRCLLAVQSHWPVNQWLR